MDIDLQKYAENLNNVLDNKYLLLVGKKGTLLSISIKIYPEENTHIIGLDHLPTINNTVQKKASKKREFFHKMLDRQFGYKNLKQEDLDELAKPQPKTYNYTTKQEYTLEERFNRFGEIDKLLSNAHMGCFYKWNNSKEIILPDKKRRKSTIEADYVLVLPSNNHIDERLYFFLVNEDKNSFSKNKKNSTLNLKLISAFADCKELLNGQEKPYTILKYEMEDKNQNRTTIFTHPNFRIEPSTSINVKNNTQLIQSLDYSDSDIVAQPIALELPSIEKLANQFKDSISNTYKKIISKISSIFEKRKDKVKSDETPSEETEGGNMTWDSFKQSNDAHSENVVKNPYKIEGCTPIGQKVARPEHNQKENIPRDKDKNIDRHKKTTKL